MLQRKSRSKVPQVASPLWCRGTFSFCSRHPFQGGVMVCFLSIFCASSAGTSSPAKNVVFTDENGIFCVFTPQTTCTPLTSLHSPPNSPTQAAEKPYTAGRSILHNVGFCVGFKHKPYTPNYTDFQTLSTFCVGFAKNADRP